MSLLVELMTKSSQIESMGTVEKPASAFVLAVKKESLLLLRAKSNCVLVKCD